MLSSAVEKAGTGASVCAYRRERRTKMAGPCDPKPLKFTNLAAKMLAVGQNRAVLAVNCNRSTDQRRILVHPTSPHTFWPDFAMYITEIRTCDDPCVKSTDKHASTERLNFRGYWAGKVFSRRTPAISAPRFRFFSFLEAREQDVNHTPDNAQMDRCRIAIDGVPWVADRTTE